MAEEAATATQKLNGDASEVNGLEESDSADDVKNVKHPAGGVHADIPKMNSQDSESPSDSAVSTKMDVDPDVTNNSEGDHRKSISGKSSSGGHSPRGLKRRANSVLSNKSDDGDELTGFEDAGDLEVTKRLSLIIDKMEAQFRKSEIILPTPVKLRRKELSPNQQRIATPIDNLSSRPSSGLSQRSEEHAGGVSSSNEVTSSATNSPVPGRGNRKSIVDLASPLLRIPLDRGWKRELVIRAALDAHSRRTGDIYYYTPAGKKLRSTREVGDHLSGTGLTLDNFSFFKEPLGIDDPEKEIIRDAKVSKGSPATPSTPVWSPSAAMTTPRLEGKRTPKPKQPKGASPDRGIISPRPKPKQPRLQVQALLGTAKGLESIPKADSPTKVKSSKKPVIATNNRSAKTPSSEDSSKRSKRLSPKSGSETPKSRETPKSKSDKSKDKVETSKQRAEHSKDKTDTSRSKTETTNGKADTSKSTAKADTPKSKSETSRGKVDSSKKKTADSSQTKLDTSKSRAHTSKNSKGLKKDEQDHFTRFYNVSEKMGYNSVEKIFQYLKMRELAAAARVCTLWRRLVEHPSLWKHVRMKNSQVNSWKSLCTMLKRHGTVKLDLRKMLLPPSQQNGAQQDDSFWTEFVKHLPIVESLERLELCRCPAWVVEQVCRSAMRLKVFNALSIQCEKFDPSNLNKLNALEELRLKSQSGLSLTADLKPLAVLTNLKHLSLTSIKDLGSAHCDSIGSLVELESAELGECSLLPADFGAVLCRLPRLRRLRLERGASAAEPESGARLLRRLAELPSLVQLELVNFDVKPDFDEALARCTNLRRLLLIPTYVSQSATTNRQVLSGLLRLKDTLTHLMWGVTIELLRVTELFIDQCEQNAEKKHKMNNQGDCIPVLKPVPGFSAITNEDGSALDGTPTVPGPPQVEILPLPLLQKLLSQSLPNTKLKVLKIPFHATWRQTLADFQ